jgi:acyl carrier protein
MTVTAAEVHAFVAQTLSEPLRDAGHDPAALPEDFDLLESGVIDSFGVIELIVEVNERFGLDIDFEELDPEGLTIVGPFSRYVAAASA